MDSQGPDVKVRGNAATIYEKYTTLARDAKMGGSRVKAENLLQHAEHYLRLMNVQEAAKQEAREKAEAERAAREEARANSEDDDEDQGGRNNNRRHRNNRRDRDEVQTSDDTAETPSALEVVTPKADVPKVKSEKKPRKPKAEAETADATEEKPKRRRKAPARKTSSEDEAVEAAE